MAKFKVTVEVELDLIEAKDSDEATERALDMILSNKNIHDADVVLILLEQEEGKWIQV